MNHDRPAASLVVKARWIPSRLPALPTFAFRYRLQSAARAAPSSSFRSREPHSGKLGDIVATSSNWSDRRADKDAATGGVTADPSTIADFEMRCRESLALWLRWNDAYERVTEQMYQPGTSQQQLQDTMDQVDELRRKAIILSHDVLDRDPPLGRQAK